MAEKEFEQLIHDLKESRALWLLALIGTDVVGRIPALGPDDCLTLAKV